MSSKEAAGRRVCAAPSRRLREAARPRPRLCGWPSPPQGAKGRRSLCPRCTGQGARRAGRVEPARRRGAARLVAPR